MKLLLITGTVALLACVVANNINDGAGPSSRSDEDSCTINENIEVLFNLIFGLNSDSNNMETFSDWLDRFNVMHIIYNDQFRIFFSGFLTNDANQPNFVSRLEYFFQRVLLRMEEMTFESSRPDGAHRREIQYTVDAGNHSVEFIFDCRLSLDQARRPVSNNRPRCTATTNCYQSNGCHVNTLKLSENSNQAVPRNFSSRQLLQDVTMPCVLMSSLAKSTRNENLEELRSALEHFFWAITLKSPHTRQLTVGKGGLNIDFERLMTDDEYLKNLMLSSNLANRYNIPDADFDGHNENYLLSFYRMLLANFSFSSTARRCINTMWEAFPTIWTRTTSTTTRRPDGPGRFKRFTTGTKNDDIETKKLEMVIRQRLTDFAFISLQDQTEANYLNRSLR